MKFNRVGNDEYPLQKFLMKEVLLLCIVNVVTNLPQVLMIWKYSMVLARKLPMISQQNFSEGVSLFLYEGENLVFFCLGHFQQPCKA